MTSRKEVAEGNMTEPCYWCGQSRIKDKPYNSAPVVQEPMAQDKIKLWVKFVNHSYAAWSALFELITGFKPPKMKDVAALISGKN